MEVVVMLSLWKALAIGRKKEKLEMHVGGPSSTHNKAAKNCQALMDQRQHLQAIINKQSQQARSDYRFRLNASVDCARLLLSQGLAFRGHDESGDSSNPGNFKAILKLICLYNEDVKRVAIHKCPGNHKLTSADIQKDIVHACAIAFYKLEARTLSASLHSFEFAFCLHLMKSILGITNELSQALQRKDQDIVNAMTLVRISKERLQLMRDNGWNSLLDEVYLFCSEHDISILDMDSVYIPIGRLRRHIVEVTNFTHYKFELFTEILDLLLSELNGRFNEVNTELLLCFACLNPSDSFFAFHKEKLLRVAQLYQKDFSSVQLIGLENQLETYIMDMKSSCEFLNMKGISQLAEQMVKSRKDIVYPLVYKLITLALILPVATATVERAFSAMKLVKNRLRNKIGD